MLVKVARWFAYTDVSLDSLIRQGVPEERISVVNNTLVAPKNTFSEVAKTPGKFLYIGGLYKDKRLDLIIDAFKIVYQTHPNVRLTIVGTGPLASQVEDAASRHDGIDWLGAIYGEERNRVIAESDAILMPGLVGLVAVDAFYFRAPILTSHAGQHSPEVAYLKDGFNALFDHTSGNAESFARLMRRWLDESGLADSLREGCTIAASQYTIENMVERFIAGVSETLDH
jgi:glycosyltransferase involved in cell wall biosynthesis